MISAIVRTHCRLCEAKLKDSDDPSWGMCAACLEQKRLFWQNAYDRIEGYAPSTGAVKYPNREA